MDRKKFLIFILKTIVFVFLVTVLFRALFWFLWKYEKGPEAYAKSYQRALLKQIYALEDADRDPRVIVFGSSYVPYGIDKETLEESIGDGREVQTLGIEAAIGIPYLTQVLRETAKEGDTVIYMLGESNPHETSVMSISAALEPDKEKLTAYWKKYGIVSKTYLCWRKIYALTASVPVEKLRSAFSKKEQIYNIDSFDEKGNMTVLREGTQISPNTDHDDVITIDEVDLETIADLNDFNAWCGENGVEFIICFSPTVEESWSEEEGMFESFDEDITAALNAPVLGSFGDYTIPAEYFFNHPLHLNTEGAKIYSKLLGEKYASYK